MSDYELTVVLPGDVSPAKKKSFSEKIEKLVKVSDGKIDKTDEWGKIDLSYKIKKEESGFFLHFKLSVIPSGVKNLKEKIRIDGDIIRYLLVKTSKS